MNLTEQQKNRGFWLLFLALFIDLLGFGIMIPLLPFYAESLGASAFVVSLLMAVYSLAQFLFAPLWGRLSDRYGRRPIIMIGLLGTSVSFILFGFASTLFLLFFSRLLGGILTAATLPTSQAYVADISSEKERAKKFGLLGAAFGLGFMFGPALGGLLSVYGYAVPAFFAAGLAFLNFVGAWFWLPESFKPTSTEIKSYHLIDFKGMWRSITHEHIGVLVIIGALIALGFSQLQGMYALFAEQRFGLGPASVGIILFVVGVVSVIVQGAVVGKVVVWIGEIKTIILGTLILGVSYTMIGLSSSTTMLYVFTGVNAAGFALSGPSLNALISERTHKDEQGTMLGFAQSWGALARVIGPPFAGILFGFSIALPFYSGAFFMLFAMLMAVKNYKFYMKV